MNRRNTPRRQHIAAICCFLTVWMVLVVLVYRLGEEIEAGDPRHWVDLGILSIGVTSLAFGAALLPIEWPSKEGGGL